MGKSVFKGTIILTIFGFLSKGLGAIFKIGLSSIVGSYGLGLYQLIFPLLVFFICLSSEGFAVALTVKIAESKNSLKQNSLYNFGKRWCVVFALISSIFLIVFGDVISKIQGGSVDSWFFCLIAIGVFVISLLSIKKSQIRGLEQFTLFSIAEVVEDILKVVLGMIFGLMLVPYGIETAVAGVVVGIILSALISYVFLIVFGRKILLKASGNYILNNSEKRDFIVFALMSLGASIVVPAVQFIESSIIIELLNKAGESSVIATKLYGISRGSVSAIINLPFFALASFEILLLPNLARSKTNGIYYKKTSMGLLFAVFVSVPFVLMYVIFPDVIMQVVFGKAFSFSEILVASNLLRLGAVGILFSSISVIMVIILNGNDRAFSVLVASISAGVVKIIALLVFVPKMSIYGAEISSVSYSLVFCFVNVLFAFKNKLYTPSRSIIFVIFSWLFVFLVLVLLNNLLIKFVVSEVVALITSICIIGFCFLIVGSVIIIKNKNKIKKALCCE